LIIFC